MNIPEIYLTEPYNAYAPKGRKKHWHEVIEEQALMARILAEAAAKTNTSPTLPPNSPPIATPVIVPIPPAGGGAHPTPQYFNPSMTIDFNLSPSTASAPALVAVTNTGDSQLYALDTIYLSWDFGDGTTAIGPNPIHLYTTTGSNLVVTMSAVAKVDGTTVTTYEPIKLTAPTVTAAYTLASSNSASLTAGYYTASAGDTITFINGTTTSNPSNPLTYQWSFGDATGDTVANPTHVYVAGNYNVLLSATGSFGITSAGLRKIQIV